MNKIGEQTKFILLKTEDDFYTEWCGRIIDSNPIIQNNKFIFVIIGSQYRLEINTNDINYVEKIAKKMTKPKGRQAVASDSVRIYIKEKFDNEKLLGVLFHNRTKVFAPVYDNKEEL